MTNVALPDRQPLPTGATTVLAIVGHPTVQVQSPRVFNARFAALGIDAVMFSMDVVADRIGDFVSLLRGWKNTPGCIVTVPHKQAMAAACDTLSPRAAALGAVNVVRREGDGRLSGDITDGLGFVNAARGNGLAVENCSAAVLGCGGAGGAIADALAEAGAARLRIADPERARAERLAGILRDRFPSLDVDIGVAELSGFDLAVNASPLGMNDDARLPHPPDTLAPPTLVADVVTRPEITPWLAAARERGCAIQTGAEMTAGQVIEMSSLLGFDFSSVP